MKTILMTGCSPIASAKALAEHESRKPGQAIILRDGQKYIGRGHWEGGRLMIDRLERTI